MRMLLVTALMLSMLGCSGDSLSGVQLGDRSGEADAVAASKYGRTNGTVAIPFKSQFFTVGQPVSPDFRESCGDRPFPPFAQAIQEGSGEATHLGGFDVRIIFCGDISALLDGDGLTEGESIPYFNSTGTFTAANGDELWIEGFGEVKPSDNPDFDYEFFDAFQFVGGTGRFEGASGAGTTNSFVVASLDRTEHEWTGTLILPRGK